MREYRNRISGPLLDRIDLQIEVPPVPCGQLADLPPGESSAAIRARVLAAREIQRRRFAGRRGVHCNADIPARDVESYCRLDAGAQTRIRALLMELDLSARAYVRVLKMSRTVADLRGAENVSEADILETATYRALDRSYWT